MRLPPLLSHYPRPVQLFLVVVLPALYGALTGYLLGVSAPAYVVLSLLGVLGGIGAGLDHLGAAAGARRGVLAGSIFGGAILIAHAIHGASAKVDLPDPPVLLLVFTTVLAVAFGAFGGWIRERTVQPGELPGA